MSRKSEPFEMGAVEVLKANENALLVKSEEYGKTWIPFSQLHDDSAVTKDSDEGDRDECIVTQWFAEERGWA